MTGTWLHGRALITIPRGDLLKGIGLILLLETVHMAQRSINIANLLNNRPMLLRWVVYYALCLGIIFYGVFEHRQFIYFQF